MDEDAKRFAGQLMGICEFIGDASIESDDPGDRWLDFRSKELNLWGQVRSRFTIDDKPIWEITIGRDFKTLGTIAMERKNG